MHRFHVAVWFLEFQFGRDELLSPGRFHQMAGRAGRKGLEHR